MYAIDISHFFGHSNIIRLLDFIKAIETMKPIDLLLVLIAFNFDLFMLGYIILMIVVELAKPVLLIAQLALMIGTVH